MTSTATGAELPTPLHVSQIPQTLFEDFLFGSIERLRIIPDNLTKHKFQE
jgi:hypothetical protein